MDFAKIINSLKGKNFSIDRNSCSIFNKSVIMSKFNILNEIDPCYSLKAIKNPTEIKNINMNRKCQLNNDCFYEILIKKQPFGWIAGTELITRNTLKKCRNIQVISRLGVGIDNIDLEVAKERNIKIFDFFAYFNL